MYNEETMIFLKEIHEKERLLLKLEIKRDKAYGLRERRLDQLIIYKKGEIKGLREGLERVRKVEMKKGKTIIKRVKESV